jgi:uncharacterized integral membrane protein (TIGR00698 family)
MPHSFEEGFPVGADLFQDVPTDRRATPKEHVPGLLFMGVATLAAGFLADHYHVPITLMALLIGLALNEIGNDKRLEPGLLFASHSLLRIGIVLVGLRISTGQLIQFGPMGLAAVCAISAVVLLAGVIISRLLGHGAAFGALAGGAVAICGASAALAIATTLGKRRVDNAQLTLVLVGTSAMSALAMVSYPLITRLFHMGDQAAGFVMGAAIHDVAQSLGAGYAISAKAGGVATIVKMTRVALLAPALLAVRLGFRSQETGQQSFFRRQWFVIGFFVLAALNSLVIVPVQLAVTATDISTGMLACAVTATAMRSPLAALKRGGLRPLVVTVVCSLLSLALAMGAAHFLLRAD